jgi:hypothetical protein
MYEDWEAIAAKKGVGRAIAGEYRMPLDATDAEWLIPSCLWSPDGGALSPSIGTVDAAQVEGWDGSYLGVVGTFPLDDGNAMTFSVSLPPDGTSATIDGAGAYGTGAALAHCIGSECWQADDTLLLPCRLAINVCDRLEFDRGWFALDQHHWAGSVGAGFAALVRARGELDGATFDVTTYADLDMSYGHHAFSRGAQIRFDPPIGEVCAARLSEVSEYGAADGVWETFDCAGNPLAGLTLVDESHTWHDGPCE